MSRLSVYQLEPDQSKQMGFLGTIWVYLLLDPYKEEWAGISYASQRTVEQLFDDLANENMLSIYDYLGAKEWEECRVWLKKHHSKMKPYCYLSFDKPGEKDCVCDIIDVWNSGCPSSRGKRCRSKK